MDTTLEVGIHSRNHQPDGGPGAFFRADIHPPPLNFHEALRQRQAEAGAAAGVVKARSNLPEWGQGNLQFIIGHADALVGYFNDTKRLCFHPSDAHRKMSRLRRVFNRVG